MDKIIISELSVETLIGTQAWERQVKQKVLLDLELYANIQDAAAEDDLSKTIDYAQVAASVTEFIAGSQYLLIEALAEATTRMLLENVAVEKVLIKITKLSAISNAKSVSVVIERHDEKI